MPYTRWDWPADVSDVDLLFAQQAEENLPFNNPSATFGSAPGIALPLVDLPKGVSAPGGKITLWTDFAAADENGVPLYVVNQTNKAQVFNSQDSVPEGRGN